MSHYDVEYSSEREALLDTVRYVGMKTYKAMVKTANYPDITLEAFRMACSFAGVQGYPIKVMWERYHK